MSKITASYFRDPDRKITCLTCYDYLTARVMDQVEHLDMILVGDSLGMVSLGYDSTIPVTMDDMVHHTAAVSRGVERAFLVADLPYLEMARGGDEITTSVRRLVQEGGAQAVKIEGGKRNIEAVKHLVAHDVPVVGHLGLTPQSVEALGGYSIQGTDEEEIKKLGREARALEEAGILALVLECVPAEVAAELTRILSIPTIGIGAGSGCSGQVLVWQDMMGLTEGKPPTFVRKRGELKKLLLEGVESFCQDVRDGDFPAPEESFELAEEMSGEKISSLLQS